MGMWICVLVEFKELKIWSEILEVDVERQKEMKRFESDHHFREAQYQYCHYKKNIWY